MMKKMKKLAALTMALTLTASLLSTAALAAEMEENEYEPSLLIETMDEEIIIEDEPAEKPCSVEFIYAAAGAVDGAVAAPEGVTAPEKIEDEQSFRLNEADLTYGTGEIPEGYTFSGWYIEDGTGWYKVEDILRMFIVTEHTQVYGYWTYTAPEQPEQPAEKPCSVEFIYAAAGVVDGAVAAPEGVTAPEKIEDEQSFRLNEADLTYGIGEIPEGYTFSGWYIEDGTGWYKVEDVLGFLIIYSHTEVYGYWTYTETDKPEVPEDKPEVPEDKPEVPEDKPEVPEDKPEVPEDKPEVPEDKPEAPDNGGNNNNNNDNQTPGNPKPPVIPPANNDDVAIDEVEIPLAPETVVEEVIEDERAPLAAAPEVAETPAPEPVIVGEAVPMGNLPQTGTTHSDVPLYILGAVTLTISLTAAGATLVLTRKKEND